MSQTDGYIVKNKTLIADILNWLDNYMDQDEGSMIDSAEFNRMVAKDIATATTFLYNSLIQSTLK